MIYNVGLESERQVPDPSFPPLAVLANVAKELGFCLGQDPGDGTLKSSDRREFSKGIILRGVGRLRWAVGDGEAPETNAGEAIVIFCLKGQEEQLREFREGRGVSRAHWPRAAALGDESSHGPLTSGQEKVGETYLCLPSPGLPFPLAHIH